MEKIKMVDRQSKLAELQARLDELERMTHITTDRATLERIAERQKMLREALNNI